MKPHALIIDDNSKNLGVLAQMLTMEGATYTEVQKPNLLAAMLNTIGKVDVVFLDLEMPGLTGYEVLDMLRANVHFQNVPIVAYTVHVSEITVAHKSGFHSFLGKPLDVDKFPDQLARILRGEPVWETV